MLNHLHFVIADVKCRQLIEASHIFPTNSCHVKTTESRNWSNTALPHQLHVLVLPQRLLREFPTSLLLAMGNGWCCLPAHPKPRSEIALLGAVIRKSAVAYLGWPWATCTWQHTISAYTVELSVDCLKHFTAVMPVLCAFVPGQIEIFELLFFFSK